MGCSEKYYRQALQKIAMSFCDAGHVKQILKEDNTDTLENIVSNLKKTVEDKDFYFESGAIFSSIYALTFMNAGNDSLNACVSGLDDFEEFIKGL